MLDFVKRFSKKGGRPVGSDGHAEAQRIIEEELRLLREKHPNTIEKYSGGSFALTSQSTSGPRTNYVARLRSKHSFKPPILIGAHYDTCGATPGADDNAAAVAIGLTTLEMLATSGFSERATRDIVFAFF